MIQRQTGQFFLIFANILITFIAASFAYISFILATINQTIGPKEFTIITISIITIVLSWILIFFYLKKSVHFIVYIFIAAGLIGFILSVIQSGLALAIPSLLYLFGAYLILKNKHKAAGPKLLVYNNWKFNFIFIANALNTFIWLIFSYIFLLLIGNDKLLEQLFAYINPSFITFFVIGSLLFILANWVMYFVIQHKDQPKLYFYFLIVAIINLAIGVYNMILLNDNAFPPENELFSYLIQAPVFLFLFPGILYVLGFILREKPIIYQEN